MPTTGNPKPPAPPSRSDEIPGYVPETHTIVSVTRREGEGVIIGHESAPIATVRVIEAGRTVRLAVSAARDTKIIRHELAEPGGVVSAPPSPRSSEDDAKDAIFAGRVAGEVFSGRPISPDAIRRYRDRLRVTLEAIEARLAYDTGADAEGGAA